MGKAFAFGNDAERRGRAFPRGAWERERLACPVHRSFNRNMAKWPCTILGGRASVRAASKPGSVGASPSPFHASPFSGSSTADRSVGVPPLGGEDRLNSNSGDTIQNSANSGDTNSGDTIQNSAAFRHRIDYGVPRSLSPDPDIELSMVSPDPSHPHRHKKLMASADASCGECRRLRNLRRTIRSPFSSSSTRSSLSVGTRRTDNSRRRMGTKKRRTRPANAHSPESQYPTSYDASPRWEVTAG
jgi:hypothetical protein